MSVYLCTKDCGYIDYSEDPQSTFMHPFKSFILIFRQVSEAVSRTSCDMQNDVTHMPWYVSVDPTEEEAAVLLVSWSWDSHVSV